MFLSSQRAIPPYVCQPLSDALHRSEGHVMRLIPRLTLGVCLCMWFCLGGVLSGCAIEEVGFAPPHDHPYYPLGLSAHPDGRYIYVSNAMFDRKYRQGTLSVIDTFEERILSNATAEIGLFAGELKVVKRPCSSLGDPTQSCDGGRVFGFTVSRDEGELITMEIDASRGDHPAHLSCGQPAATSGDSGDDRRCQGAYVQTRAGGNAIASAPYSLSVDGEGLYLTHVKRGALSHWSFLDLELAPQGMPVFECQVSVSRVQFVAQHPLLNSAFTTSSASTSVMISSPTQTLSGGCRLSTQRGPISTLTGLESEARGAQFSADGALFYLADSTSGALHIFDTSVNTQGNARRTLLKSIPLGRGVNVVRVAGLRPDEARASNGLSLGDADLRVDALGQGLVYVSLFDEDQVAVIDPERSAVIAMIDVGENPHDITFLPNADGELRGYVTNFSDHSVSVLDLHPGSPSRFQMINTIK